MQGFLTTIKRLLILSAIFKKVVFLMKSNGALLRIHYLYQVIIIIIKLYFFVFAIVNIFNLVIHLSLTYFDLFFVHKVRI